MEQQERACIASLAVLILLTIVVIAVYHAPAVPMEPQEAPAAAAVAQEERTASWQGERPPAMPEAFNLTQCIKDGNPADLCERQNARNERLIARRENS